MDQTRFLELVAANAERDQTTGMFKGEDGTPIYYVAGKQVGREEFDAKSGLSHLPELGFDDVPDGQEVAPAWFASFCTAVIERPAPVVMVGACRSGKTRLTDKLQEALGKLGAAAMVSEHQRADDISLKNVHLVVFRQARFEDAAILSERLGKANATPDELLALPRWRALIRLAGGDTRVVMVDTSDLYQQPGQPIQLQGSENLAAKSIS